VFSCCLFFAAYSFSLLALSCFCGLFSSCLFRRLLDRITGRHFQSCQFFFLLLRSLLFGLVLCLLLLSLGFLRHVCSFICFLLSVWSILSACCIYETCCGVSGNILLVSILFSRDSYCIWPRNLSAGPSSYALRVLVWEMATQSKSYW
jgi:hypothetical protein